MKAKSGARRGARQGKRTLRTHAVEFKEAPEGAGARQAQCPSRLADQSGETIPGHRGKACLHIAMHPDAVIIQCCPQTGLYVGYVPGFPGAHSQGATLVELDANLREVIEMLSETDG